MILDFDLSTAIIFSIICLLSCLYLRKKKHKSLVFLIFYSIFFAYIVAVLSKTQFDIYFDNTMSIIGANVFESMNLIPLIGLEARDIMTSVLNVIMFIPFGFLLPFVARINFKGLFIWAATFSYCLEMGQLISGIFMGGTLRVVDINDVIFNITGAIIGYISFIIFYKIFKHFYNKNVLPKENPIIDYIYKRRSEK